VQISVLSWILSTRYGLAIEEIGMVWAAGPLAGILGQLLVGGLSDRVWAFGGRRRLFIIIGGSVAALAILMLPQIGAVSQAIGLPGVFAVAITVALALDLAVNVGFNPTRALIADVTSEGAERAAAYSSMQVISGSFGVGAYAIGALFGNDVLIGVAAGLVLVFAVAPSLAITEPRVLSESIPAATRYDWRSIAASVSPLWAILVYDIYGLGVRLAGQNITGFLAEVVCAAATLALIAHALSASRGAHASFRRIIAASALCWLGVQPIFVYMVSFLQSRMPWLSNEALGQTTAVAFLAMNGVGALAPLVLGPLARSHGALRVHVAAVGSMALGCFTIWLFAATPWQLYAMMAWCGVGWGSIVSLPFAILSDRVAPARMGLFMGLFNLSVVLPQLVTSLGIGTLVGAVIDKGVVFGLSGLFILLSAVCWHVTANSSNQNRVPQ
jgi:MFS family permease